MPSEQGKLYQDRLYGTKVLSPLAVALVDSAEFQRLAGLRQLGFSDLAYRAAQHTRFEHSVGTHFVCRTMLRRIVQNHERLLWEHPGTYISERFATYPDNWAPSGTAISTASYQARWRGMTEVVCAAALLHDVGHVPFGHTLEDEFTGIYGRHDRLAGPRLFEMFFEEKSDLAKVFSDDLHDQWIKSIPGRPGIKNSDLGQLIYVMLNWKDKVDPPQNFFAILDSKLKARKGDAKKRLTKLRDWHEKFVQENLFKPFMSDVIGNTICADLIDYLPRDRQNLGMEVRFHQRLQRYLTIRPGTLYPNEGPRISIMVTRKGHGGQRRDVTTAVLDIMRERFEMAERVYNHHKKAAASTMLAKLTELAAEVDAKPRGEEGVYPAPWGHDNINDADLPHMVHLSDWSLIDYLGVTVPVRGEAKQKLQRALHRGLRFDRKSIYRTLLVIDSGLVTESPHPIAYFSEVLRGPADDPSNTERLQLERELAAAAGVPEGDVLIYCPSPNMQAKEVESAWRLSRTACCHFAYNVNHLPISRIWWCWRDIIEIYGAHMSS
jgi:HD superfamily phosphohydrolase